MRRIYCLVVIALFYLFFYAPKPAFAKEKATWWGVQSIDTMKYSRDTSKAVIGDPAFDKIINSQISKIARTGATHVSIGTPYDKEFLPVLTRWVRAARKNKLKVWFRGNWSGWEGWFGYPRIDRKTHIEDTRTFILDNPRLFEDGDIFTACPECENGGPGDPRRTGDVSGYRIFMIKEYHATYAAFGGIGKEVASNYNSMNGDVAKLIMDKDTTKALGGVVVIDHYVSTPKKLADDITSLARRSGGLVILGEFGAPIPDIHGRLSEEQQAEWLSLALTRLVEIPELVGVNYWVGFGGSTSLWRGNGEPRKAAEVVSNFYTPKVRDGVVKNEIGQSLKRARVFTGFREVLTDNKGRFQLPFLREDETIAIIADGYKEGEVRIGSLISDKAITLQKKDEGFFFKLLKFFYSKFG